MRADRQRPRVVWVIRQLARGGSEKRLYESLRRLFPDKLDLQVITFEGGPYEAKIRELGVPLINLESLLGRRLKRLRTVISEVRAFRADIVHGMDFGGFYGRVAAKFSGVPVILSGFNGSRLPNRIFCWIEYALSLITDYVISNSYAGKEYLINTVHVNPDRIRVIPNGFDFEAARGWEPHDLHRELGLDPARPIVGQVARLTDVKDPFLFVEAAARVHSQVPQAHFVIVGAGPSQSQVERLIAARGMESHLTLAGDRPDAVKLIPSFAVGVLTSREEGLPNALLEYMFCARPSVVTEVGDCGRIVQQSKAGYVVPSGDADRLAERIIHLLRNPVEAATLGRSARTYLEQEFSMSRYCDSLLALYEAALEQHRHVLRKERESHTRNFWEVE